MYGLVLLLVLMPISILRASEENSESNAHETENSELREAAAKGDLEAVKQLCAKGVDPLARDKGSWGEDGDSAVAAAVRHGHVAVVEWFVANGTKMDDPVAFNDQTLLAFAVGTAGIEMVQWLLDHGAEADLDALLRESFSNKDDRVARLLLERGADVNTDGTLEFVQFNAILDHDLMYLHVVVEAGANLVDPESGKTAWRDLAQAMRSASADIKKPTIVIDAVSYLVSKGLPWDPESIDAAELMAAAVWVDDLQTVQWLHHHGVPLSAKTEDDVPVFADASAEMLRWFRSCGADVSDSPAALTTLFSDAIARDDQQEIRKLQADGLVIPYGVMTLAASGGDLDAVRRIEALGLDPAVAPDGEAEGVERLSGVYAATLAKTDTVLAHFFESGRVDIHDPTLLEYAVREGRIANLRVLLAKGCDANAKGSDGHWTALHWAVFSNDADKVSVLLAAGACKDVENEKGETPVDLAKRLKRPDIIKLLQQ